MRLNIYTSLIGLRKTITTAGIINMNHPIETIAEKINKMEKVFAVGFRDDMPLGQNRFFSVGATLFATIEQAEKFKAGTICEIFEFNVPNAREAIERQKHRQIHHAVCLGRSEADATARVERKYI